MMNRILYIAVVVLCSMQCAAADQYNTWWQKGNNFYAQKEFDSAAFYYEKIAALEPDNATVYYNLGNAYYRLNKVGPAVLNYEKALRIDPSYNEARENLTLTQSRIPNRIPVVQDIFFISWWNSLTQAGNTTLWAILCLVIFIGVLAIFALKRIGKLHSFPPQVTGILSLLWVLFLVFAIFSAQHATDSVAAVVMQADAPLLNAVQGKTQSLVPEGTTVKLSEVNGKWVAVRLPDGRSGWMQLSLLAKI